jgi:hypothetical protein
MHSVKVEDSDILVQPDNYIDGGNQPPGEKSTPVLLPLDDVSKEQVETRELGVNTLETIYD